MKLSIPFFLISVSFLLMSFSSISRAEQCNSQTLSASYTISEKLVINDKERLLSNEQFSLLRKSPVVAHEFPDKKISVIWSQLANGYLRPVRYFDKHKRGIEYGPLEINNRKGVKDWGDKYQLVADDMLDTMSLTNTSGEGCERLEFYTHKNGKNEFLLSWMPELKLVKSYKIYRGKKLKEWNLDRIEKDSTLISHWFKNKDAYEMTDYADIGDSESDPFLQSMIFFGFL